jgi:hypothetical protein
MIQAIAAVLLVDDFRIPERNDIFGQNSLKSFTRPQQSFAVSTRERRRRRVHGRIGRQKLSRGEA